MPARVMNLGTPADYDDNAAATASAHYFPELDMLALELW
jgi:hypothetical protein